jgi:methyl-accepting chemotaxis protein
MSMQQQNRRRNFTSLQSLVSGVSLTAKLAIAFISILLIFTIVGGFTHWRLGEMKTKNTYESQQTQRQRLATELKLHVQETDTVVTSIMITEQGGLLDRYEQLSSKLGPLVKEVSETAETKEQRKWGARLTAVSKEFVNNYDRVIDIYNNKHLNSIEKQSAYASAYAASQLHKAVIFELVGKFYDDYLQSSMDAKRETTVLLEDTRKFTVMAAAAAFIVCLALIAAIVFSFRRGLQNIHRSVAYLSVGDLRHSINAKAKDELGQLCDRLDESIARMKHMLLETKRIAQNLRDQSLRFDEFARSTAEANGNIVAAMGQIAAGTTKQAEEAEQSSTILYEWVDRLQDIDSSANELLITSHAANEQAAKGDKFVDQLKAASDSTAHSLLSVQQSLSLLEQRSTDISVITSAITEVSHRTNILAINASIESSRAGEQGRGFAVIAEEVRELSLRTRESSKHIEKIVSQLRSQMADALSFMSLAMERLNSQNLIADQTHEAFRMIFSMISRFDKQIFHINELVRAAKEKQGELSDSVQIVASIAQQTAASLEETASATEEQDRAIRRIAAEAQSLNRLSESLFEEINAFKIDN